MPHLSSQLFGTTGIILSALNIGIGVLLGASVSFFWCASRGRKLVASSANGAVNSATRGAKGLLKFGTSLPTKFFLQQAQNELVSKYQSDATTVFFKLKEMGLGFCRGESDETFLSANEEHDLCYSLASSRAVGRYQKTDDYYASVEKQLDDGTARDWMESFFRQLRNEGYVLTRVLPVDAASKHDFLAVGGETVSPDSQKTPLSLDCYAIAIIEVESSEPPAQGAGFVDWLHVAGQRLRFFVLPPGFEWQATDLAGFGHLTTEHEGEDWLVVSEVLSPTEEGTSRASDREWEQGVVASQIWAASNHRYYGKQLDALAIALHDQGIRLVKWSPQETLHLTPAEERFVAHAVTRARVTEMNPLITGKELQKCCDSAYEDGRAQRWVQILLGGLVEAGYAARRCYAPADISIDADLYPLPVDWIPQSEPYDLDDMDEQEIEAFAQQVFDQIIRVPVEQLPSVFEDEALSDEDQAAVAHGADMVEIGRIMITKVGEPRGDFPEVAHISYSYVGDLTESQILSAMSEADDDTASSCGNFDPETNVGAYAIIDSDSKVAVGQVIAVHSVIATRPDIAAVATTIARIPWNDGIEEFKDGDEAREAQFDGAYVDFYVLPPGTALQNLKYDHLDSLMEVVHEGSDCVVVTSAIF